MGAANVAHCGRHVAHLVRDHVLVLRLLFLDSQAAGPERPGYGQPASSLSSFGRIGSITAPLIIGVFATRWGFAGVFGMTTTVLAIVVCTLLFAVRTAGRSLEDITMQELRPEPMTLPKAPGSQGD